MVDVPPRRAIHCEGFHEVGGTRFVVFRDHANRLGSFVQNYFCARMYATSGGTNKEIIIWRQAKSYKYRDR